MRAVSQKFIPNMMPDSQKNCTMSIQEIGDERIRLEEFWVSVTADNESKDSKKSTPAIFRGTDL
jgi:hypothetical protein